MARRFIFRLHALLRLREVMETEARRNLARKLFAQQELEGQLVTLREERSATFESRRSGQGESIDLQRWRIAERFLVVLERREARVNDALRQATVDSEQARAALLKARQAKMTLLRLKERRQAIHEQENDLKERREVDDLAVLRSRFVAAARQR
jgi:flagellar FliJ protein